MKKRHKLIRKFVPTIGLEVHVELRTSSKMFCGCLNDHFGVSPNTHTCPVCLGLPGALPVPNRKAIEWAQLIGLALNCQIEKESKFDRKHYFYPDLPKGYQISQYDEPLCKNGYLKTHLGRVGITRVHLEEDTGKLLHKKINGENVTLVDFNRSGVSLVEIVSQPDIRSGRQAKEFSERLQDIIRYLGVSDCDMEKGSMRLEANISFGLDLGYKVEVKNLNSFRFVERAIDYELERQQHLLLKGTIPLQETRGWSERDRQTKTQRYKETAADYRYFPEPDVPPLFFTDEDIEKLKKQLPELPDMLAKRFLEEFKIEEKYVKGLVSNRKTAMYAQEAFLESRRQGVEANQLASLIINRKVDPKTISPEKLVELAREKTAAKIADKAVLEEWITRAIVSLPQAVDDFRKGKTQAIAVLIGKVMQLSSGRADPLQTKAILEEKLKAK